VILGISAGSIGGELLRTGSISAAKALGFVVLVTAFFVVGFFVVPELLKLVSKRRQR
jgi:hypothetical protein